ncbi:hypothetical protein [Chitinimonas sp. JJ19]|uniref:hypothetical protein n=1 Tax=Chitinimonas sp. JJ19 TaxID=3109352 RepID=UPI003002AF74
MDEPQAGAEQPLAVLPAQFPLIILLVKLQKRRHTVTKPPFNNFLNSPTFIAARKLQERLDRQLAPFQRFIDAAEQLTQNSSSQALKNVQRNSELARHTLLVSEQVRVAERISHVIEQCSFITKLKRGTDLRLPQSTIEFINQYDSFQKATNLGSIRQITDLIKHFSASHSAYKSTFSALHPKILNGLPEGELSKINATFLAIADARKFLDSFGPDLSDIDFSHLELNDADEKQAKSATEELTRVANDGLPLGEFFQQFTLYITNIPSTSAQAILIVCFLYLLDSITQGYIGALAQRHLDHVFPVTPKEATTEAQKCVRTMVGPLDIILKNYRIVTASKLKVRHCPRALSPEIAHLTAGNVVMLLKKEKDFTLVSWKDTESGVEIQGWVFSRYLQKLT